MTKHSAGKPEKSNKAIPMVIAKKPNINEKNNRKIKIINSITGFFLLQKT